MRENQKLPREFYTRDTVEVARDVLGKVLVHQCEGLEYRGRIVEVEAYLGVTDKAAHSYSGIPTKRTAPMFELGGIAYVYLVYGLHHVMNIVTQGEGVPEAIMFRAVEIISDKNPSSQLRYGRDWDELSNYQRKNLSNGPGKLTQALGISTELSGISLMGDRVWLEEDGQGSHDFEIGVGKRVGIDYAEEAIDFPLRFFIK